MKFQVPIQQARLSFSIVSIAYACAFFLLGPLSDYFEARKMASNGCILSALSLSIAAYSTQYDFF
jgi:sugar phosphate permease